MPYIGYWQLMAAVDKYVVYDDVKYIKGGWVSRNNILMNGQSHMFTITLNGASPNKKFNEISVRDDFVKFSKTLICCYKRAPFFHEVLPILEEVFTFDDKNLGNFLFHSFQVVLDAMSIKTELILSSTINKDNSLRAADKVKHICKILGGDAYYNAIGGQSLYDKTDFATSGITLKFLRAKEIVYPQYKNTFVPNLSIIDVLMFNGIAGTKKLLNEYALV